MSDLKEIFTKNEGRDASADISPEEYKHIRVMRDDLDELSGKAPQQKPVLREGTSAQASSGNPFLEETPVSTTPTRTEKGDVVISQAVSSGKQGMPGGARTMIIAGAVVLMAAIAGAVYLFVSQRSVSEIVPEEASIPVGSGTESTGPDASSPAPVEKPYSITGANYLQLDTESSSATPDGIATTLAETASKMSGMGVGEPVEFLVRDMNNNPIAFSRFAYLLGLKLPTDLLADMEESFSLYLVRDGADVRRALIVQTKDAKGLGSSVTKHEAALPSSFAPLLYGKDASVAAEYSFRDGSFGTIQTRFAIVNAGTGLSFDHVLQGSRWVVGTSKDSFQAVLGNVIRLSTE